MRPHGVQHGVEKGSQIAPRSPLGTSWPPEGLLEWSRGPLVAVWEASWALLERVLQASWALLGVSWALLRRSWRLLRAKSFPKLSPGGSQIGCRRRLELKMAKPCFLTTVYGIVRIFEVPGHHFVTYNRSKMGSESHLRRGSHQKAIRKILKGILGATIALSLIHI